MDREGEGWISLSPIDEGFLVELDGVPMFAVTTGDARASLGETPEVLANRASRTLRLVWAEAREQRNPAVLWTAALRVAIAGVILGLLLVALVKITRWLRQVVSARLTGHVRRLSHLGLGARFANTTLVTVARALVILSWLLELLAIYMFVAYSLSQFAFTRPIGQNLNESLLSLVSNAIYAVAGALPGLFIAVTIFLIARFVTQMSRAMFQQVARGRLQIGSLDAHTAPATRQIVNAAVWLFAIAMSYSYLPGAETEAFKGLSVILGIMVSIGAAGLVGQVASGMILVFTRSLLVGEYVRVQDCEGTVTHLGPFVTRIRTGLGEEVVVPNSLVVTNITRNFSRAADKGYVINVAVSIGYDTPWRHVHELLIEAADRLPAIKREPAPYVIQTALSDFYVSYTLVAHVDADSGNSRPAVSSELNAAIQDVFTRNGVQIMSPHYVSDPAQAKIPPEPHGQGKPVSPPSDTGR